MKTQLQNLGNQVLQIINGQRAEGPVCASPLVTVTLSQMKVSGLYYPTAHEDPPTMARLASLIHTSVGFDGIRVPFDLCVEAEALGCKVRKGDKESPPMVVEPAFKEKEAIKIPGDVFEKGRFHVVFEAIRILKIEFGSRVSVFAGMVGPLTLIGSLYDAAKVMRWAIKDPERMRGNLDKAAGFLAEYANRLLEAGADVISMLDPTASGDLLSQKHFERDIIPVYQKMRKQIKGPIVLHICGRTTNFLDSLPESGFEAFSFEGPKVSVKTAREKIRDRMILVGNVPTYDVLLFGTPERVREESLKALEEGIDILAPACGIPIQTPVENLRTMVEAVEEFRMRIKNG